MALRASLSTRLAMILLAVMVSQAAAQSVGTEAGRVIHRETGGRIHQVTSSGLDTMPALSPDGHLIAFVRRTPGDTVETSLGGEERTELWVARTDGTRVRRLVRGRGGVEPQATLAGMANPAFSPDGRTIYFESEGWVTSGGLHAVDLATSTERFVCAANGFEVLSRGRYRGYLLVAQHRYRASGSYDGTWIVSPAGHTLKLAALEEAPDAAARLAAVRAGRAP